MPYPKKLLNDGEEVALDLRPHWWFFSKHIASGIPLFVIVILILAQVHGDAGHWLFLVWALVAVVWAVWLGLKYLEWNFTHFVVTDDRVDLSHGCARQARRRDPDGADQQHQLPPGHLGTDHRRR